MSRHLDHLKMAGAILALLSLCSCRTMPVVDAKHMPPEELIRILGPPSRIAFNKTVFGNGWVKGAHEYRYYLIDRRGDVGYYSFFYKDQEWLSSSTSVLTSLRTHPQRLMNIKRHQHREKIENFEASRPWLKRTPP